MTAFSLMPALNKLFVTLTTKELRKEEEEEAANPSTFIRFLGGASNL